MKALLLILGLLLLAVGIFGAVAPEATLDLVGQSHQEQHWSTHNGIIPYPQDRTVYHIDPSIVRALGGALAAIGLVLVVYEITLERRGV